MIIGITGTNGAGKGTVVACLEKKGFVHFSARTLLYETIDKKQLPRNRENLIKTANELREKYGSSYVAETLFERAKNCNNAVIESLRTIGEIQALRNKGDFKLIAVDAESNIRHSRILARNSETDNITYESFVEQEKKEMNNNDPNKQNIAACISEANVIITNNDTFEALYAKIEDILND